MLDAEGRGKAEVERDDGRSSRGGLGLVAKNARQVRGRARRQPTNATLPRGFDPLPHVCPKDAADAKCAVDDPLWSYAWGVVAQPPRCTRAASGAADEGRKSPGCGGGGRDQQSPIDSVCEHGARSTETRQQLHVRQNHAGCIQSTAMLSCASTNKRPRTLQSLSLPSGQAR